MNWRKNVSGRENSECNAGMSLGVSIRNLSGAIKRVVGYKNLELKRKVCRDKDLGVSGIRLCLKQQDYRR